jgi:hypothetical protein
MAARCVLPELPTTHHERVDLQLREKRSRAVRTTYSSPRDLAYVEELVIPAYYDPVFGDFLALGGYFHTKQTSGKCRKGRWDIIVFELVQLPTAHNSIWLIRCGIQVRLYKLWRFPLEGKKFCDEQSVLNGELRGHFTS